MGQALRDAGRRPASSCHRPRAGVNATFVPQVAPGPRIARARSAAGCGNRAASYGRPVVVARCAGCGIADDPEAATSLLAARSGAGRRRRSAARRGRGPRRRRRHRRGRLHRPVDGHPADRHGSGTPRRGPRGGHRGLRRERPERRVLRGQPDPRPGQRHPALPRRAAAARAGGHRQPAGRSSRSPATNGIDCDLEETGTLALADQAYQVEEFRAWVDEAAEHGEELVFLDRGRRPGRGPLPAVAGRAVPAARAATSWSTRRSCAAASRGSRASAACAVHEGTRVTGLRRRAGGVDVTTAAGARVRRGPRRRRDVGVLGLAAPPVADLRAGLRLRPRVGVAVTGTAGVDRLGPAAGPGGCQQPVPLLPADGGRPDPVGRLRRDPLPGQPGRSLARPAAGDVRQARGPVLPGVPAARRASPSRTAGAAPSTRRRGSRSRSARRWAGG